MADPLPPLPFLALSVGWVGGARAAGPGSATGNVCNNVVQRMVRLTRKGLKGLHGEEYE
jgi:hypothetical protein